MHQKYARYSKIEHDSLDPMIGMPYYATQECYTRSRGTVEFSEVEMKIIGWTI